MSRTGDSMLWIGANNRILDSLGFRTNILNYFNEGIADWFTALFPTSGWFAGVQLAADGNDKFKLTGYANDAGVGRGRILTPGNQVADMEGIQFENSNGIEYDVACAWTAIAEGIQVNPKDGMPNWLRVKDVIGIVGEPDSVVDNGDGTLTAVVDAVTEAGASNAGRTVAIFQLNPAAGAVTEAIAKEEISVAWDGSNNKITTVDDLGQATISTTAADYMIILLGPHVVTNPSNLSTEDEYAYLGTVTGAGAGNPPTVFDITGQTLLTQTSADLWHVLRQENVPPNRWKIDVKAIAAEENTNTSQARVTGWDGVGGSLTVFDVDELGNVSIQGDLTVQGETTQEDVVTINSSQIITDNLTAGDNDADTHALQGEWTHITSGGGITAFAIDGDTGRVGIGGTYDGAYLLSIAGSVLCAGHLDPSGSQDFGASGTRWANGWFDNLNVVTLTTAGHFLPATDDTYDLGEDGTPLEWRNIYIDGTAYIDSLSLSVTDGEGLVTHLMPSTDNTRFLGDSTHRFAQVMGYIGSFSSYVFSGGRIQSDANEPGLWFRDLDASEGNHQQRWRIECTVDGTIHFRSYNSTQVSEHSFITAVKNATTYRVDSLTLSADVSISLAAETFVTGNCSPAVSDAHSLGEAGYIWQTLFLDDTAGFGVADNLVPNEAAGGASGHTLGNADYRWHGSYFSNLIDLDYDSSINIKLRDSGAAANERIFRFTYDDGAFYLRAENDSSALFTVLMADRAGSGTESVDEVQLRSHKHLWLDVDPGVGDAYIGIGEKHTEVEADTIQLHYPLIGIAGATIGTSSNPIPNSYFTAANFTAADVTNAITAGQVVVDGNIAGIASTNSLTGISSPWVNGTGGCVILPVTGSTALNSSGFIKIYVGVAAKYIPYFDTPS